MSEPSLHGLLGIDPAKAKPHLYDLFGLPPGETDPQRIEAAVQATLGRLKAQRPQAPAPLWERAAKSVTRGRQILSDPVAKADYDRKLGLAAPSVATATAVADPLQGLLPADDPLRPFDIEAAAARAADDPSEPEEEETEQPARAGESGPLEFLTSTGSAPNSSAPASAAPNSAAPAWGAVQVEAAPRRRQRSSPLGTLAMSGFVVGLFVAIGVCLHLLLNRESVAVRPDGSLALSTPDAAGEETSAPQSSPTGRSAAARPEPHDPVMGSLARRQDGEPRGGGLPEGLMRFEESDEEEPQEAGEQEVGERARQANAEAAAEPSSAAESNESMAAAPPADASPPEASREEGEAALEAARAALRSDDPEGRAAAAAEALRRAADGGQRQRAQAIVRLVELAEHYTEGIRQGMASLGAGESFELRPGLVAVVVDSSRDEIILRIEGRNRTYAWDALPLVLAHRLVRFGLSPDDPRTTAGAAAFQVLSPRATEEHYDEAFAWWQEVAEEVDVTGLDDLVGWLFDLP